MVAWLERFLDRITKQALAAVDSERVIEHRDVQAWAESLLHDMRCAMRRRNRLFTFCDCRIHEKRDNCENLYGNKDSNQLSANLRKTIKNGYPHEAGTR